MTRADCQSWIADHYPERNPVNAMVRLSGLAERSFKRRFQQATGMSPLEYVHTMRIEEAKQLDMPAVTAVMLEELDARIADGFGHDLPVPFYSMPRGRFRRELL